MKLNKLQSKTMSTSNSNYETRQSRLCNEGAYQQEC